MIDKLNIGQKFIITYRPNTHNGEARPKLKNGKDTRQITRRAQWNDKCLIKLIDSPMKDKVTDDEVIKELQKKLKKLSNEELKNTFWEIETGEFINNDQIKELELERDQMIKNLDLKDKDNVHQVLVDFCKKYEDLCSLKYPDAPLPLEVLKSTGS